MPLSFAVGAAGRIEYSPAMSRLPAILCSIAVLAAILFAFWLIKQPEQTEQTERSKPQLPSLHISNDDVQYFAPGPEFKLSPEAAAMKAYKAEHDALEPVTESAVTIDPVQDGGPTADFDFHRFRTINIPFQKLIVSGMAF